MLPFIVCLCPTYGRPQLVANSLACFQAQTYPADRRHLIILDDAGQYGRLLSPSFSSPQSSRAPLCVQNNNGVSIFSTSTRFPHLPSKYSWMIEEQQRFPIKPDVYCVWDDDDIYLPDYITHHVAALYQLENTPGASIIHGWSHPTVVFTDYPGHLVQENAAGRFHGSICFTQAAYDAIGGWRQDKRADFDQDFIARLNKIQPPARPQPVQHPQYIFRWASTKHHHCQGLMSTPDNQTWYDNVPIEDTSPVLLLKPQMDTDTLNRYMELASNYPAHPS